MRRTRPPQLHHLRSRTIKKAEFLHKFGRNSAFWRLIVRAGDDVFLQSTGELDEISAESADANDQIAVGFGVVEGIDQGFAVDNGDGELLTAAFKIRFGQGFKRRLPFGRIEERFHELQVQNKVFRKVRLCL